MASSSSRWAAPSLTRYKPAILALTALAAGCTIYYIHEQIWSSSKAPKASLQRSNANRQRHRPRRRSIPASSGSRPEGVTERSRYVPDVPWDTVPVSLDFLTDATVSDETFGDHIFFSSSSIITPLRRRMPFEREIRPVAASDGEALEIRRELEESFLCFYFWKYIPPSPITDEQRDMIVSQLGADGDFSAQTVVDALQWHQDGTLTERIERWERLFELRRQGDSDAEQSDEQDSVNRDLSSTMQNLEGRETLADVDSVHSWRGESRTYDSQDDSKEGQNLGNLLWRIAEEQARKESYVHRGVTCNSCSAMPIKGIRYRCSNCVDFDLCEQCEALQTHPKTHLFYKVRIPTPFLCNSRQPQPVWYPGRPTTVTYSIPKELMEKINRETEYQAVEIEALWEQFRCLAATEWDDDPSEYNLAIDKRTFDKCFVLNTSTRPPIPNLIYDRAFSFYDMDNNGLIGFREFVNGRAALTRQNPDERRKRIFKGYDIDNDGFVHRRDFLRMFRAYYALTKELTLDIINGTEDDASENGARDIVLGSQPISSAFSGAIPPGELLRLNEGKRRDEHGDYQIYDDIGGAVDDRDHAVANPDEVLADYTEAARFGRVQRKGLIGPWIGDDVKNEAWPPGTVSSADLQKVFPHLSELKDVTSVPDQEAVRRVAHERIAREHQERQFVRRIALRNRKQRQSFYVDGGDAAEEEKKSGSRNESTAASLHRNDKSRKDDLGHILRSSKAGDFRTLLVESIKAMDWPLESPEKLMNDVFEMISNDWGGREIAEDLSGYGSLQHDAFDFVATFDSLISHISDAVKAPDSQESADEQRKSLPSSSSRRSRSSSKVRFRDDLCTDDEPESRSRATSISSRSIPVNERWGGFVPEPEKDVGREVLYLVTQEALNELLDPVFRLREDLALAAVRTRRIREKYREEIIAAVKDPRTIKKQLDIYQKRWRMQQQNLQLGYLGIQEAEETFGADELLRFMSRKEAGQLDDTTGERCSECKGLGVESWIWAGGFCEECGKPSAEAVPPPAIDPDKPLVFCSNCPICGVDTFVPGKLCGICDPPKEVTDEKERLWNILRGTQDESAQATVQEREEPKKPTSNEEPGSLFPPNALEDVYSSVSAFHDANPLALEEKIAQKPLQALLAESGYTTASPTMASGTLLQAPDPTPPQNRPNQTDDCKPSLGLAGASDVGASVSASPQPSLHTERPVSPPPDPTLPQNRPNSLSTPSANSTEDTPSLTFASTSTPETTSKGTTNGVRSKHYPEQDQNSADDDDISVEPVTLRFFAALSFLEAEDKERGGPGRLSFTEWEDIVKGEKGSTLGFLSSWIDVASF